jgi:hypothetical protein
MQYSAADALLGIAKGAKYGNLNWFTNSYYLGAETDEIRLEILDCNIIESLGELLRSDDSHVCSSAVEALSALTENGTVKYFNAVVLLTIASR